MTADYRPPTFWEQSRIQIRVIWALVMREMITRFGREGLGVLWMMAEPAMFVTERAMDPESARTRTMVASMLLVAPPTSVSESLTVADARAS